MMQRLGRGLAAAAVGAALLVPSASAGGTVAPPRYKNCTNLNKLYPPGVGRLRAVDKTKSGDPVTSFKRSTRIYNLAMSFNKGLDRDKDGVACEAA